MAFVDFQHGLNFLGVTLCWAIVWIATQGSDLTPEQFVSTYSNHRLSSDFILSVYQNLSKGQPLSEATGRPKNWREVMTADTIRAFPAIAAYQDNHQQLVYKFNVSQMKLSERLRAVELRLRLPAAWSSHQELEALTVASTRVPMNASAMSMVTTHFGPDEITLMDITTAVRDWFDYTRSRNISKGLTLDMVFSLRRKRKFLDRRSANDNAGRLPDAILVAYTEAGDLFIKSASELTFPKISPYESPAIFEADAASVTDSDGEFPGEEMSLEVGARAERSANFKPGEFCRLKDLQIDFVKIGWGGWVVFPTQFNAYQCGGKCRGFTDSRYNMTNHAMVQSLVRMHVNRALPVPCCSPTKLAPISILYLEKGEVVIKQHHTMIVKECGCM